MIQVLNVCGPSPEQWDMVVRGIRNPFKGQTGGDSSLFKKPPKNKMDFSEYVTKVPNSDEEWRTMDDEEMEFETTRYDYSNIIGSVKQRYHFGKRDLKLAGNLANAGPDHGKFLRELPVIIECRAPLYWWKQLDAYRVSVPAMNSESTMHTITKKSFELSDFSCSNSKAECILRGIINQLNRFRDDYFELDGYENDFKHNVRTKLDNFIRNWEEEIDISRTPFESTEMSNDELVRIIKRLKKEIWMAMIELLPESYYQTRTFITTYAGLRNIYTQRVANPHKLPEWKQMFDQLEPELPYYDTFIVGNQSEEKETEKTIIILEGYGEESGTEILETLKNDPGFKIQADGKTKVKIYDINRRDDKNAG